MTDALRALIADYAKILRQPSDRSAFGLETSWLIYDHARSEIADELDRLAALAAAERPQQETTCETITTSDSESITASRVDSASSAGSSSGTSPSSTTIPAATANGAVRSSEAAAERPTPD